MVEVDKLQNEKAHSEFPRKCKLILSESFGTESFSQKSGKLNTLFVMKIIN